MKTYRGSRRPFTEDEYVNAGVSRQQAAVFAQVSPARRERNVIIVDTGARTYEIVKKIDPGAEDELDWGYAGDGPRNAALSILADLYGQVPAFVYEFEREVVAGLARDFELSEAEIRGWEARRRKRAAHPKVDP